MNSPTTEKSSPLATLKPAFIAGMGGAFVTLVLALLNGLSGSVLWLMAPFGASLVIVFALPASPLAQPRNLVGGHLLTAGIGLLVMQLLGVSPLSMALAVGMAIALMMLTDSLHPPAGANPLLIMLAGKDWGFLFTPVLSGCLAIVALAWIYHRSTRTHWPQRWF